MRNLYDQGYGAEYELVLIQTSFELRTMDQPISVQPHPFRRSFHSIQAAVAYAMSHPLRFDAQRDAQRLVGSLLVDGYWTLSEWCLRFSNGLCLRIWVPETEVRWHLTDELAEPDESAIYRVGSAPIWLRWLEPLGVRKMDCSEFLAKRRGAPFRNLHVNHTGLYLYFEEHLVLDFGAIYRVSDGENILHVFEGD